MQESMPYSLDESKMKKESYVKELLDRINVDNKDKLGKTDNDNEELE